MDQPQKQWNCDECPAAFGRLDHLRRHVATHNEERQYGCQFCGALFSRGDVLRRHWKSCKARKEGNYEVPESQRGGKHKRACDSCASIRKACSGAHPCSECNQRGRTCSYQRLEDGRSLPPGSISITSATKSATGNSLDSSDLSNKRESESPFPGWELGPQNFYSGNIIADVKRVQQQMSRSSPQPTSGYLGNGDIDLAQLADQPTWSLGPQPFYPAAATVKNVLASREQHHS